MNSKSAFKRSAAKIIALWIALLILVVCTKLGPLALVAISLTGAMPFILFVLWLGLSDRGTQTRAWFAVWHWRVFFGALLFCYITYGHKWAGDIINELFHVDARFFGITSTVLTVLFTPFGIFYRPDLAGYAFDTFNIVTGLIVPPYVIYLLLAEGVQNRAKKIAYLILGVAFLAFTLAMAFNISNNFKTAVKAFALWADFNENHLCTDSWARDAKSVVFLDNGKVLGNFPQADDYKFKVVSCDYAKKF
ncbi:MAG: hypothetical protein ACRETM_13350 [Stenotrophobium sp.]